MILPSRTPNDKHCGVRSRPLGQWQLIGPSARLMSLPEELNSVEQATGRVRNLKRGFQPNVLEPENRIVHKALSPSGV